MSIIGQYWLQPTTESYKSLLKAIITNIDFVQLPDLSTLLENNQQFIQQANSRYVQHTVTLSTAECYPVMVNNIDKFAVVRNHPRHPHVAVSTQRKNYETELTAENTNTGTRAVVTVTKNETNVHILQLERGMKLNDYLVHDDETLVDPHHTDTMWYITSSNHGAAWHMDEMPGEVHQETGYKVMVGVDGIELICNNQIDLIRNDAKYNNIAEFWNVLMSMKSFQWTIIGRGDTLLVPPTMLHCTHTTMCNTTHSSGYYYLLSELLPTLALSFTLFTTNKLKYNVGDDIIMHEHHSVIETLRAPTNHININICNEINKNIEWVYEQLDKLRNHDIKPHKCVNKFLLLIKSYINTPPSTIIQARTKSQPKSSFKRQPIISTDELTIIPSQRRRRQANTATDDKSTTSTTSTTSSKRISKRKHEASSNQSTDTDFDDDRSSGTTMVSVFATTRQDIVDVTEQTEMLEVKNILQKLSKCAVLGIDDEVMSSNIDNMDQSQLFTHMHRLQSRVYQLEVEAWKSVCKMARAVRQWYVIDRKENDTQVKGNTVRQRWGRSGTAPYGYEYACRLLALDEALEAMPNL